MQMLMWSCGIAISTFYSTFPLFSLSTTVCICLSASLYHCHLSLHLFGSHWECISLCVVFFYFFTWLFFPSQASEFPLLFPYILDSSFNSLLCQLGDRYTVLYLKSSVTTANSETSCISKCFLVKEDKSPPSTFFLEILWEGMNGMATAMLMAIIVETGRSPGEGNGNPLQCSCLENPIDGGAW